MGVEEREGSPSGDTSSLSSGEELCEAVWSAESGEVSVAAADAPPGFRLNTTERQAISKRHTSISKL